MENILGLDLGTNSIGWAIVNPKDARRIIDAGVVIFSEGVKIEKGVESSRAAERTGYRSTRRRIARRRKRKQDTLKVLIENNMCPLTMDELLPWLKDKKQFPVSVAFRQWLAASNEAAHTGRAIPEDSPYYLRAMAAEKKIAPYQLGRVFYHLAQRRGFLSSRLDKGEGEVADDGESKAKDTGVVKEQIKSLTEELAGRTLGQYFYNEIAKGNKVRARYIGRKEHYFTEFYKICETQELTQELTNQLFKAIFYVRPLKSQKGLVGKCPFEKNKARSPISHPDFEQFRMFQFINTIKVVHEDGTKQPISKDQVNAIIPLFFRKSKPVFTFVDIKKKLSSKKVELLFNYKDFYPVSGCPTIASLISVFGEDWENALTNRYKRKQQKNGSKTTAQMVDDVWHALFSLDDDALERWTDNSFDFTPEERKKFLAINLKQGYASLSLHAIRKILPHLKSGFLYSHAAFFANLPKVLGSASQNNSLQKLHAEIGEIIDQYFDLKKVILAVNECIAEYKSNRIETERAELQPFVMPSDAVLLAKLSSAFGEKVFTLITNERKDSLLHLCKEFLASVVESKKTEFLSLGRIDDMVKELLINTYKVPEYRLQYLYHPSDIETVQKPQYTTDGKKILGSPFTPAVRNPVVMRTLHLLRKLINTLILNGSITEDTPIHIELARGLNNANQRRAIERYQRTREKMRADFRKRIVEHYMEATGVEIVPTEDDVLKYELWEEQKHICLYTGAQISITGFIGSNPAFDIEHTIPRSISYDDSMVNLSLCAVDFNRNIKKNRAPAELHNHAEILNRLAAWEAQVTEYEKLFSRYRKGSGGETKEIKDDRIAKMHYYKMHLEYWRTKVERFKKTDFTQGFKNSQLVDTGVITKMAFGYIKTVFNNVVAVKGVAVDRFRKVWGIEEEYAKKVRDNHVHHAIDAVVIACMTRDKYAKLATLYRAQEQNDTSEIRNTYVSIKPWSGFTEDLKELKNTLLVTHRKPDNTLKRAKKKITVRGKVQFNAEGKPKYKQGDSVRGALHLQTFYGAIQHRNDNGTIEQRFVIRKSLLALREEDLEKIVDPIVRKKIEEAVALHGFKNAVAGIVWMNEEKQIPIKKVRLLTSLKNPLAIKSQSNASNKEYKQPYYAANDSNYLMVLYEGKNPAGKTKRGCELISTLAASRAKRMGEPLFPLQLNKVERGVNYFLPVLKRKNKPIALRNGMMCILCDNEDMTVDWNDRHELQGRLFTITGLSSDGDIGIITVRHCQEARPTTELGNGKKGAFVLADNISYRRLSSNNFVAYIEGIDFKIEHNGEIKIID